MTERIYNFSAGPAVLPVPVLEKAREEMLSLPGVGMSVMEISHRSKTFDAIHQSAKQGLKWGSRGYRPPDALVKTFTRRCYSLL